MCPLASTKRLTKASFLSAIVNGDASSPIIDRATAVELLGNMHGGYNVETLVKLLDDDELAAAAATELKSTTLVFDAFHDVAAKADAGNEHAKAVCNLGLMPNGLLPTTRCRGALKRLCLK